MGENWQKGQQTKKPWENVAADDWQMKSSSKEGVQDPEDRVDMQIERSGMKDAIGRRSSKLKKNG
jgi:hypothetical protein